MFSFSNFYGINHARGIFIAQGEHEMISFEDKQGVLKPLSARSEHAMEDNKKKNSQGLIRLRRKQKNRLKRFND